MTKEISIQHNESLYDAAINNYGSIAAVMALAAQNGQSVTIVPEGGAVLNIPTTGAVLDVVDKAVLTKLRRDGVQVGTAALPSCPITGTVDLVDVGSYSVVFYVELGAGGVGIEWAILPAAAPSPSDGAYVEGSSPEVTISGLAAETDYKIWTRTKCSGKYSGWVATNVTTLPPPPLALTPVLVPALVCDPDLTAGAPHTVGFYRFVMRRAPEMVNVYELGSDWLYDNNLLYITQERLVVSMLPPEDDAPTSVLPMSDVEIPYELPYSAGLGYMLVYSDQELFKTFTFRDVEGNEAKCCPMLVLDNASQEVIGYLLPELILTVTASTTEELTLRVQRRVIVPFGLVILEPVTLTWLEECLGGSPDPAAPLNPDRIELVLTPGTYTLGVKADFSGDHPAAVFTMVIEIA